MEWEGERVASVSLVLSILSVVTSVSSLVISKRQKNINESNYKLSLFKERCSLYNEFIKLKAISPDNGENLYKFIRMDEKDLYEYFSFLRKIPFIFDRMEHIENYIENMQILIDNDFIDNRNYAIKAYMCRCLAKSIEADMKKRLLSFYKIEILHQRYKEISEILSEVSPEMSGVESSLQKVSDELSGRVLCLKERSECVYFESDKCSERWDSIIELREKVYFENKELVERNNSPNGKVVLSLMEAVIMTVDLFKGGKYYLKYKEHKNNMLSLKKHLNFFQKTRTLMEEQLKIPFLKEESFCSWAKGFTQNFNKLFAD